MITSNFEKIPEPLNKTTDKIIKVKYFKINSLVSDKLFNKKESVNLQIDEDIAEQLGGLEQLKHIEAFNVTGKSMEPLIKDKSLVFIDRSKTSLCMEKENVYIVNTPVGVVVKKVKFIPTYNKIQLIPVNKLYTTELFDLEDVTIIGKVIGMSSNESVKEAA